MSDQKSQESIRKSIKKTSEKKKNANQEEKDNKKKLEKKIEDLKMEINKQEKEIEELKENVLRKTADMENMRKRVEREKSEYYQYALFDFLKELLAIMDNFERALESKNQKSEKGLREGIEMIYKQWLNLMQKVGVKPIALKDQTFDPHVHQAFISEESEDVSEPKVLEEYQKGYKLNDRLLRPSLVKVVMPKKDK
ncbi:MAG: nucleotide exchange factor GrpE [Candidatus Aminicenantes bacterium]|nr:nucleotide exchange factor GrpE [Candidatus Aminicenantes bacterium]